MQELRDYGLARAEKTARGNPSVCHEIPVSEECLKELSELKEPDESYDDVVRELIRTSKERQLGEMVREKREHGEFVEIAGEQNDSL